MNEVNDVLYEEEAVAIPIVSIDHSPLPMAMAIHDMQCTHIYAHALHVLVGSLYLCIVSHHGYGMYMDRYYFISPLAYACICVITRTTISLLLNHRCSYYCIAHHTTHTLE